MAAGIFISYRRDESRHAAGRLADDLSQAFGAGRIFRDIEGIKLGVEFAKALENGAGIVFDDAGADRPARAQHAAHQTRRQAAGYAWTSPPR